MAYDFWYWDGIPGRGEFVRLALEAGAVPYRECARSSANALPDDMQSARKHPPFAPPYLISGEMVIAQTANILMFLGEKHGLAPASYEGRLWVNQLQLTIADMVAEVHDTHHPVSADAYYEDQQAEAVVKAHSFRKTRLPKYLAYFESLLAMPDSWLADGQWSYADLSLFQLIDGLLYAFPRRMHTLTPDYPNIMSLHRRVAALPQLQAYFQSSRRLPYNENGIFRHYPQLDGE
ncbi:glutathione S-transferase [Uruburuella testudinis]|uniref:Glutathione S-transferase n=1 Tax=Uruburuella testudinis TaxID=1282863 RepID=A0ABY4DUH3_9NEIS|nr:glutathione S-transferase [Uruburuella testudinis]UOO82093.1 glutathione S-transferase [Uruburuella testudinis]